MKNKELDIAIKKYIVEAISTDGYDFPAKSPSDKMLLQFLYDTFRSEYGWSIERYGEQKAFSEWIMGLPSSFNVDFENYKILQLAVKLGSIPVDYTEKQADNILANWWNFITAKTFQLFRKHKVTK